LTFSVVSLETELKVAPKVRFSCNAIFTWARIDWLERKL